MITNIDWWSSTFLVCGCQNNFFHILFTPSQVVPPLASNYPAGSAPGAGSSGPFSWVPRQMLSGDTAEEEGESDGESDGGEEERGEGEEAELVIDIPNE